MNRSKPSDGIASESENGLTRRQPEIHTSGLQETSPQQRMADGDALRIAIQIDCNLIFDCYRSSRNLQTLDNGEPTAAGIQEDGIFS